MNSFAGWEAFVGALSWLLVTPLCLMLGWFSAEIACGLPRGRNPAGGQGTPPRWPTIVVPAHDEALGIGAMLTDLLKKVPAASILVVADNCSDATATIARASGVAVVERADPGRRGKGYALACARDKLAAEPPGAVMILDADCRIAWGDPRALAARAAAEHGVVQAENLQVAPPGASPVVQIGAFAFRVMNLVRARGLERLGGGAFVQGTGTVFPWRVFERLQLATGNAVEDIDITLQLARMSVPVRLDSRVRVTSWSADRAGHLEQRRRWEHGFVRSMRQGLPLLAEGVAAGSRLGGATAAHMLVPPLALLALTAAAVLAAVSGMALAGWSSWLPAIVLAGASGVSAVAILGAWFSSREILPFGTLLRAPLYVLWKLPIYLGLMRRGGGPGWTRTKRAEGSEPN